ncbi:MAG TPA: vitamin K epoxide reductase family protein [Thermoanaerobaculia bacterium]|nr:vitamin K epoxide reductase family protein [Thermoanaerobaculia bacterium]
MRRETAPGWTLPLLILLAFGGAVIGLMLTSYHLSAGKHPWKLFQMVCGTDGGGCTEVLSSGWAVLPGGIPLAALGFLYFGGLFLWYLVVGLANRRGRFWQALPFAVQIAGVLTSLFLFSVMLAQIHAVCWWCILSHVINFVLLFAAWKAWPRDDGYSNEPAQPSPRLGFAGILLVVALAALTLQRIVVAQMRAVTEQANQYAQTFYGDIDLQRYLHLRQPQRPLAVRPDDPMRGTLSAAHTVVVFSDFQCPACRSFAEFSERELLPRFGSRLRIVYKHYPLEQECNPGLTHTLHPQACEAAFAAEAARELGGDQAFWKIHDLLFAHQEALSQGPWADLARQAGVDGPAVAERVARRAALDRILEDTQLGRSVAIDHTPTVFLDGRPVDDWSRVDVWQALVGG